MSSCSTPSQQAIADLDLLFATTARAHDQPSRWSGRKAAAGRSSTHIAGGGGAGILFGRERYGLQAEEVALANRIITFPVNPAFASLNLAQAVLADAAMNGSSGRPQGALPYRDARAVRAGLRSTRCRRSSTTSIAELDKVEFLRPPEKRDTMLVNLRNIFTRHGADQAGHAHAARRGDGDRRVAARGPAKGGVLDGAPGDTAARAAGRAGRRWRRPPTTAARCVASRGCCAAIRPTPNV